MKRIRTRLTYANIVATLALLFAMSGGALAARHYLVSSTNQISPKVLKKLKVPGRTGPKGPIGPAGPKGDAGEKGVPGVNGASALTPLPKGASESGLFSLYGEVEKGGAVQQAVTFPIPLSAAVQVGEVVFTDIGTPTVNCPGPGRAAAGFLCIYSSFSQRIATHEIRSLEEPFGGAGGNTGLFGFQLTAKSSEAGFADYEGSYTVTGA